MQAASDPARKQLPKLHNAAPGRLPWWRASSSHPAINMSMALRVCTTARPRSLLVCCSCRLATLRARDTKLAQRMYIGCMPWSRAPSAGTPASKQKLECTQEDCARSHATSSSDSSSKGGVAGSENHKCVHLQYVPSQQCKAIALDILIIIMTSASRFKACAIEEVQNPEVITIPSRVGLHLILERPCARMSWFSPCTYICEMHGLQQP